MSRPSRVRALALGALLAAAGCQDYNFNPVGHCLIVPNTKVLKTGRGLGKFPEITEPDPSYHGVNFWDAFGNHPKAVAPGLAFVLKIRTGLLRDLGACISPFNSFQIIQGLERQLEVQLFIRQGRTAHLTEAAQMLAAVVRPRMPPLWRRIVPAPKKPIFTFAGMAPL